MPMGILFWVLFVVCFLFSGYAAWPLTRRSGASLAVWILIFLLGWRVFGFVVQN